jgi:hypothetical protein
VARFQPNLMSAEVDANRRAAEQQARDAAARWVSARRIAAEHQRDRPISLTRQRSRVRATDSGEQ